MWVGFAIRHIVRKAAIGAGMIAAVVLSTKSGRNAAKVVTNTIKGATKAAIEEIRIQREGKVATARSNR